MHFGADPDAAYTFVSTLPFARFLVRDLDTHARAGALTGLRATIDAHHEPRDGVLRFRGLGGHGSSRLTWAGREP